MAMPAPITDPAPAPAQCPWIPDGTVETSADVTAGTQAGPSFLVRLRRDDTPQSVIDVLFYASRPNPFLRVCLIQVQARWICCDDPAYPAWTERWSAAWTVDLAEPFPEAPEATYAAQCAAVNLARGGGLLVLEGFVPPEFAGRLFTWDGEPAHWTWEADD